jgi:short-subunit dehydrogenase
MVFISSLSGWIGHPGVSAYACSKFALEDKLILALLHILQNFVLTLVCPVGMLKAFGKKRPI